MRSRIPVLILGLLLAGLFVTTRLLNHQSARSRHDTAVAPPSEALNRYGFYFTEVAKASGIDFTHEAPRLDPKLAHILPRVADMGAGVAVGDYDRDGWPDLYVTNSGENSKNRLYRNRGDGTFEDVAERTGVADVNRDGTGVSMGALWGDYDNDGYEDLCVYKWGRAELFRNDAGKGFTAVTERAGLPRWMNANTGVWLDYDRDGKLDLFLGGYFDEKIDLWNLKNTRIFPDSLEYATNGARKYLLKGNGDGTFEDVTEKMGMNTRHWALAVAAADLRGTGYPDIFLANDYGYSELFTNENGKRFREVGKQALYWNKLGAGPKSGMSASFGDILNQGKFAVYVSNITDEANNLLQYNNLWVPKGGAKEGAPLQYDNLANDMGLGSGGWSFGAQFGDLNNDGALDLYLTNGYISADQNQNYAYNFATVAGGNASIIADAKNWPPIGNRSLSGYQQKRVWVNDGAARFTDVAQAIGVTDRHDGRAVALVDYNKDGALDVVVANQKGPLLLYKNTAAPDNRWIGFELEGSGRGGSNRSAIGAQVRLFWDGRQQVQEVTGGVGFCAQNQRALHFGLGKNPQIEKAVIRWPGGKITEVPSPAAGTIHKVKEPE